jgi:hypothetical protein
MNTQRLLGPDETPVGFVYPRQFLHILELGLVNLEPWYIVEGDELRRIVSGLRERYPDRGLVPFARRQDNDDVACWEGEQGEAVFTVHDFASPGWEQRARFDDFWAWFRRAVEDMIEFDA